MTIRKRPARRDATAAVPLLFQCRRKSVVIDNDNDIRDGDAHLAIQQSIVPQTTQSCSRERDTDYYDQPGTKRALAHEIQTE